MVSLFVFPSLFSCSYGRLFLGLVGLPFCFFLFARLCGLLESIGRKRLGVGLFVGQDCPYRPILPFLFAFIHRSGVAQTLTMFEEVRSSELETGLSLSRDRGVLEVSSPSTPYKAWGIRCALKEKDERRIRNRSQFPLSVKVRIPDDDDRACHSYAEEVCFYEADFVNGLRFPIHPFLRELFYHLLLTPA